MAHNKSDIERRVHAVIDKFAERGLRSLAVAYQVIRYPQQKKTVDKGVLSLRMANLLYIVHNFQEVPEGRKESPGGPWQFIGLMPLFDPPRHDSADTIRRALNLGVNVKMITGMSILYVNTLRAFLLVVNTLEPNGGWKFYQVINWQ